MKNEFSGQMTHRKIFVKRGFLKVNMSRKLFFNEFFLLCSKRSPRRSKQILAVV